MSDEKDRRLIVAAKAFDAAKAGIESLRAEVERLSVERDTARAALKDAEQQNELLEDDVLRFLRQRNAALERAAAHFHPGPDGADDIIRRELVREWVDEGHDRVDEEDRQRLVAVQRMIAAESELAAAVARADTAEAAIALHFEYADSTDGGYCNECGTGWPCRTARAALATEEA